MKSWENLFSSVILMRGRDYYESGAVRRIEKKGRTYEAYVTGSMNYRVEIDMDGESIQEMYCDCPYAEDGSYCKHMAAVLYRIEEDDIAGKTTITDGSDGILMEELKSVIWSMSEETVRALLNELALQDKNLQYRILSQYTETVTRGQMEYLKKEIDAIGRRYADRDGFIEWENSYHYVRDMHRFLKERVQDFIDRKFYMEAFELTCTVFMKAANQDIDDENEDLCDLADDCDGFWWTILDNCDEDEKKTMFQWFEAHEEDPLINDSMEGYISDFLMDGFDDQEVLERNLRKIDEQIEKIIKMCGSVVEKDPFHSIQEDILLRLELMERLDYPEEEMEAWIQKYYHFTRIRGLLVQKELDTGNDQEAIRILKESKKLDQKYASQVVEYSKKLIQLYQKHNMKREWKEELIFLLFQAKSVWSGKMDLARQLKALCEREEWEDYREKLLTEDTGWNIKYDLMQEEGLYERLLHAVLGANSIGELDRYADTLKQYYPEEVKTAYIRYVTSQAERASSRNMYSDLAQYLKRIESCPGGKADVRDIVAKWKVQYRRRPAMMDELKKAGY